MPGFPSLFVTYGPNTKLAHGGIIFHLECQVRYNRLVGEKCRNMLWAHPKVTSWYKNRRNRVTVTSPWRLLDYWKLTRHFVPEDYRAGRPGPRSVIPGQEAAAVSSIERLTVG